jgi:hypothetical protein
MRFEKWQKIHSDRWQRNVDKRSAFKPDQIKPRPGFRGSKKAACSLSAPLKPSPPNTDANGPTNTMSFTSLSGLIYNTHHFTGSGTTTSTLDLDWPDATTSSLENYQRVMIGSDSAGTGCSLVSKSMLPIGVFSNTETIWPTAAIATGTSFLFDTTGSWTLLNASELDLKYKENRAKRRFANQLDPKQYNHKGDSLRAILYARSGMLFQNVSPAELVALATLKRRLSEKQWRTYLQYGFVIVQGRSGLSYRILRGPGTILVFQRDVQIASLCIHAAIGLPPTDHVLTKMVIIECDEPHIWQAANISVRSTKHGKLLPYGIKPNQEILEQAARLCA